MAEVFIQNIVKLYGFPKAIVSNQDQGKNLTKTSAYHLQSDNQTENLNKTLEMYLRCFVFDHPKDWLNMLPWTQY